ncbi:MAG: diguanylate cyclase, partial [Campylobacterota bacterium]|nr:diguanylate cyclase [Campylobacterota bacterium]
LKENQDIKIVLTDYNMPVMNGLELTQEIRKTHSKQELTIFAISNSDDSEISAKLLKSGATDYIKKPFSKEEFSCRINNAIEALENIDTITNQAIRDYLTGIYNRRHFLQLANEYYNEIDADSDTLSIAMLDIDNFKSINDSYGDAVGDRVIIGVANLINSHTSEKDIVARSGGGEFSVLFKDINPSQAYDICDDIRSRVEAYRVSNEYDFGVTISIGLYSQIDGSSVNDMISEADMLLYKAKNSGKNCICI